MKALGPPVVPRLVLALSLLGLAGGGACDPPDVGEVTPRRAERPAPGPAHAARGRLVAGERVERVVQWPGADTRDERTRARLSSAALAAVEASPVPVLAPPGEAWEPAWVTSPRGPSGAGFGYALAASAAGRTLALQGSRIATLVAGVGHHEGNARLRGGHGFVSENEGILSATWIEHGVAYALDLECADRQTPGCDPAGLQAEVEALVFVGGAGEAGGVP